MGEPSITVLANGPYAVTGLPARRVTPVRNEHGDAVEWVVGPELASASEVYELCRCGRSEGMPFCDGACERTGFDGTLTASPDPPRRRVLRGEGIVLTDAPRLCAVATFCENHRTDVWTMIGETADPEVRDRLIRMVAHCPSGRLQVQPTPDGEPIEPELESAVGIVPDGPLWVTGEVPVSGPSGERFAPRNRMTLCRCGASGNKPFCDASHLSLGFRDPVEVPPAEP